MSSSSAYVKTYRDRMRSLGRCIFSYAHGPAATGLDQCQACMDKRSARREEIRAKERESRERSSAVASTSSKAAPRRIQTASVPGFPTISSSWVIE